MDWFVVLFDYWESGKWLCVVCLGSYQEWREVVCLGGEERVERGCLEQGYHTARTVHVQSLVVPLTIPGQNLVPDCHV